MRMGEWVFFQITEARVRTARFCARLTAAPGRRSGQELKGEEAMLREGNGSHI